MAKTPSSRLFKLIKSMTGSEKRYFKLFIKRDMDSKYVQLFDAIEAQEEFDEDELIQIVYDGEQVQTRKYSELKAYLYDLIIKSLQQYDEKNAIDYQLKNTLMSVRSLYRRSLFTDCHYLLKRARKTALKYERFSSLLEILDWQKQIAYAMADIDFIDQHLNELKEEETACLAQIANLKLFQALFYELYVLVSQNTLRSEKQAVRVKQLAQHSLLQEEGCALSHTAKVLYYRIHALLSYYHRDTQHFYTYSRDLILLLESNPALLREDGSHYIAGLSNAAVSCGYLKKHNELRAYLEKLRKVKPNTVDDKLKIHRQYYSNYFSLCIRTGAFEEGLSVLNRHLKEIKKLDQRLFERNSFYFQYFYIYFGVGDYDKALEYLNQWLDLPRSVEQQDLQILARLLNLIIHYEMDNHLLLDSLIRSTQRFLQKRRHFRSFEQLLINCIRQANRLPGKGERKQLFEKANENLAALSLTAREQSMLRFFDFAAWIVAKKDNLTFSEVIQRKNKERTKK